MNYGLWMSAAGLATEVHRQDIIANNVANAETAGFKADKAFTIERPAPEQPFGPGSSPDQLLTRLGGGVLANDTWTDFSAGGLVDGGDLDLALEGDGFFEVEGPSGPLYTRNGKLRLDPQGNLVTAEGYAVAWEGRAGTFDPAGDAPLVSTDGRVSQGAQQIGRLSLVSFPAQDQLTLTRDGYFLAGPELRRDASTALVHQGALEGSNANGVSELISMVTVQRSHEMAANILRQVDQSYRRLHQGR